MKRTVLATGQHFEDALVSTMMDACDGAEPKEVTPEITKAALEATKLRREDEASPEYQAALTKLKKLL